MASADSTMVKTTDKLSNNARLLLLGIGVVILISTVGTYLASRRNTQSQSAQNALYVAQKSMESELKVVATELTKKEVPAPSTAAKPTPKVSPAPITAASVDFKKFDVETKLPETLKNLKAVVDKFPRTRAAFEARLNLGDLYFRHTEAAKAIPWYQGAADQAPSDFDRALALTALGYAYESSNQLGEAIPTYEKALKLKEVGNKGDLLLALARSYELNHDVAKARSTYDQILSQLPNTEYSRTAEMAKTQLE